MNDRVLFLKQSIELRERMLDQMLEKVTKLDRDSNSVVVDEEFMRLANNQWVELQDLKREFRAAQ